MKSMQKKVDADRSKMHRVEVIYTSIHKAYKLLTRCRRTNSKKCTKLLPDKAAFKCYTGLKLDADAPISRMHRLHLSKAL
jgi:hypothetical protein